MSKIKSGIDYPIVILNDEETSAIIIINSDYMQNKIFAPLSAIKDSINQNVIPKIQQVLGSNTNVLDLLQRMKTIVIEAKTQTPAQIQNILLELLQDDTNGLIPQVIELINIELETGNSNVIDATNAMSNIGSIIDEINAELN